MLVHSGYDGIALSDDDLWALAWQSTSDVGPADLPQRVELSRPRPNPFSTALRIDFGLEREARVSLDIHDLQGRRVKRLADGLFPSGGHSLSWDGTGDGGSLAPRGVYFVRLSALRVQPAHRSVG